MMPLLVFRERVKNFYQRYDIYLTPVVKFFFALISFMVINREIGYDSRIERFPIVFVLSLFSAFMPSAIMVLLASIVSILHVYFVSNILAVMILLILLVIYLLFARFTPRLGYVLLAVPILYVLRIPYVIPILLGLIATPIAIIPTSCGVVIYFLYQIIKQAASMQVNTTIEDTLQLYTFVIDTLINHKQMFMTLVIFALILLITYYVRRMKFDYAFEISIAVGALTSILGFLISDFILDRTNMIFSMILGTMVSAGIVYLIHFFKLTLDYSGVEYTQFEDDVYYYYVKAVPKITVTAPQMNVKHINVKNTDHSVRSTSLHRHDIDADDEYDDDVDNYFEKEPITRNNIED